MNIGISVNILNFAKTKRNNQLLLPLGSGKESGRPTGFSPKLF